MSISLIVCLIALAFLADPISALVNKRGGEKHRAWIEWVKIFGLLLLAVLPYVDSLDSSSQVDRANELASIARQKASDADMRARSLEAANAPRLLTNINAVPIYNTARLYPGYIGHITCAQDDKESQTFGLLLGSVLKSSGWKVDVGLAMEIGPDASKPLTIWHSPENANIAEALASAIREAGFQAETLINNGYKKNLTIYVGHKQPDS
jgi:hypothetical protein